MPKPLRWLRAHLGGYFWIPCPVCGRMFGGHERRGGTLARADGRKSVTCPRCPCSYVEWRGQVMRSEVTLNAHGELRPMLYSR